MSNPAPPALPAAGYSDDSFWDKVTRFARRAGRELIEKALWLHYAAQGENTPAWAKATMYGALAYFILPADMVPDLIPGAGFADDLGAILTAVATVAAYVTPEVRAKAAEQVKQWFGDEQGRPA